MKRELADKLGYALIMGDIIEALNLPLKVRKGFIRLDYTELMPRLFIGSVNHKEEIWFSCNPKKRVCYAHNLQNPELVVMAADIQMRLAKLGLYITMNAHKNREGARIAKMQVVSTDFRKITMSVIRCRRGNGTTSSTFTEPTKDDR